MSIDFCASEPRPVASLAAPSLLHSARGLWARALDAGSGCFGSEVARGHVRGLVESLLRDASGGRSPARLEATALSERLLEPLARLTAAAEAPRLGVAWSELAPSAARALNATLEELRPLVSAPHLVHVVRLLSRLLSASTGADWAEVEALAVSQNGLALHSEERVVVLASLFWTEAGTAWPALYLVEKHARSPGPPDEESPLAALSRFFGALDPSRPAPRILFATNLVFSPAKAAANAFALHNQAAVVFDVLDPERQRLSRALAARVGISPEDAARVGRLFVAGHEFGHKYDPLTLPPWTEELFADLAGFVACASSLNDSRETFLRAFLVETLSNYARPVQDRASHPYFEASDFIIDRLTGLGVLKGGPELDFSEPTWARMVRDFEETFLTLRQGRCPEHLRPGRSSPETRAFFELVQSLKGRAHEAA